MVWRDLEHSGSTGWMTCLHQRVDLGSKRIWDDWFPVEVFCLRRVDGCLVSIFVVACGIHDGKAARRGVEKVLDHIKVAIGVYIFHPDLGIAPIGDEGIGIRIGAEIRIGIDPVPFFFGAHIGKCRAEKSACQKQGCAYFFIMYHCILLEMGHSALLKGMNGIHIFLCYPLKSVLYGSPL